MFPWRIGPPEMRWLYFSPSWTAFRLIVDGISVIVDAMPRMTAAVLDPREDARHTIAGASVKPTVLHSMQLLSWDITIASSTYLAKLQVEPRGQSKRRYYGRAVSSKVSQPGQQTLSRLARC